MRKCKTGPPSYGTEQDVALVLARFSFLIFPVPLPSFPPSPPLQFPFFCPNLIHSFSSARKLIALERIFRGTRGRGLVPPDRDIISTSRSSPRCHRSSRRFRAEVVFCSCPIRPPAINRRARFRHVPINFLCAVVRFVPSKAVFISTM